MAAYYNEIEPFAVAALRELIKAGAIADGEVDARSIKEVQASDLRGFTQCHFFAGIGVWSYALRRAGWPDDRSVWTGSCPCPSFSVSGKGAGFNDPRHLWPDWYRLISQSRPSTLFGEQVDGAIGHGWLDLVQSDLEAEEYAIGKAVLGACSVGAPHKRQRLYFVAERLADSGRHEDDEQGNLRPTEPGSDRPHDGVLGGGGSELWGTSAVADAERDGRRPDEPRGEAEGRTVDGRDSEAGGLAHSSKPRCEGNRLPEVQRGGDRGGEDVRSTGSGPTLGLGERGLGMCGEPSGSSGRERENEARSATEAGGAFIVGDSEKCRDGAWDGEPRQGDGQEIEAGGSGVHGNPWSTVLWLWCRDGKYRPVESCPTPVADGLADSLGLVFDASGQAYFSPLISKTKNRVGRLRAYGNAVVAEVAAQFIRAYMESK